MAILGNEIWLEFAGGVNSALDPAMIGENEQAANVNGITRDGTVRLDTRYILKAEQESDDKVCTGSGYGKYGTGTQSEQYVAVLDNALYLADLTLATLAWVAVTGAGSLAAENMVFEQLNEFLYGGNVTNGLFRKKLAVGTNGTGDWTALQKPTAPAAAPGTSLTTAPTQGSWIGGTVLDSDGGGTVVIASIDATQDTAFIRFTNVPSGGGTYWAEFTFKTAAPDNRIDAEYRDLWHFSIFHNGVNNLVDFISIWEGTTEYTPAVWGVTGETSIGWEERWLKLQNIARANRNLITKIRFQCTVPAGTSSLAIRPPILHYVWMSLPLGSNPPAYPAIPTFQPLKYATTHYNSSTGFESTPSPIATITAASQAVAGQWVTLTAATTGEAGVSHIRFYRIVGDSGNEIYYRLGSVANSGSPSFTDKLAQDEVEALATYVPSIIPASGVTAIATWLGRLVLGIGTLVYVGRGDDPVAFTSLSGSADEFDEFRGLTFYADDRQAESVLGLCANDALYVITDRSVRCLFGTVPSNWRYVKLPVTEGACGTRAWASYLNGILVLTPSGRLLYCELGQAKPVEVSVKLRARIGNAGMLDFATSSAVVGVDPNGEIHVRNEEGAYVILDSDGNWRGGDHTHATHSLLFVSALPIRWMGDNGKLYEGGDDSYQTDGGTTGTNGVEVEGYIDSREYSLPRMKAKSFFWGATVESVRADGKTYFPKLTVISSRREKTYTKLKGQVNTKLSVLDSGERMQFRLHFDRHTHIKCGRVRIDGISPAEHK